MSFSRHSQLPSTPDGPINRLFLNNVAPLRNVQTVKELPDILVTDSADLLDVGCALGDGLQGVTGELELILDVAGDSDLDTGLGGDTTNDLLTQEVSNLNLILASLGVLLNVDVDGKVSVDVAHLVLEAPGDTDDQVVDKGANGTEGSDTLAGAVVHLDGDDILLGAAKGDGNVGEVLDELASGSLNGHNSRANVNLHILGNWQPFLGVNVPHLDCVGCGMSEGRIVDVVRAVGRRKDRNSTSIFLLF